MRASSLRRCCLASSALALAAALAACGSDGATPSPSDGSTAIEGSLRFDLSGPVRINPGTRMPFALVASASDEPVRVWLDGDYLDASLDRGIVSLATGRADLTLVAPSASTNFAIRARQGAITARLAVTVSPEGSATLRVHPVPKGTRPTPSFVAGVFPNQTCAELTDKALPASDGMPSAEGPPGATLVLTPVPAGVPMALLARSLHYAAGCTDLPRLDADSTTDIDLQVLDRALDLSGAFDARLAFEPDAGELAAWRSALAPLQSAWVDELVPNGADEAVWLLDAMRDVVAAQSPTGAAEFSTNRTSKNWNATTTSWLGARPPTVRVRATALVDAGLSTPPTPLAIVMRPGPAPPSGLATAASYAGRPVVGEWITAPVDFNWSEDGADVLRLEGVLTLRTGALMSFGADFAAAPDTDLSSALAEALDCGGLAQALVGAGVSHGTCDVSCTADLCRSALRLRATRAAAALDGAHGVVQLALNASAKADVGERADVKTFAGSWSGTITVGAASPFGVRGTIGGGPRP